MKKKIYELNLENGYPTVAEAMAQLKSVVSGHKNTCLYLIHGYGSSGKGGDIREKVRQWLNAQVRNGRIKCCIYGENFNIFNPDALSLSSRYDGLEELKRICNHGVTVVEL